MKPKKKFMIPVATALAAIAGTSGAVEVRQVISDDSKQESVAMSALKKTLAAEDRLATYSVGEELHALLLRKNADGVILAGHYSHRSHSSHSSHSSHYSSR
jgi:hypothetical protein